ncbi:type II toxin-antitoxin system prevent-host-death family antitoxin [Arthrobacter sp. efr-133-R2A-120]|uniref:type II toxin-antitoxin system prevent-host-death family antitoxin n=1 Tax=Arthrobacter sp. efr-133-R2A-120 TaxID=3040277 RepID=UPI00254B6BAE|nr:type II toxin-antitoxin system prevent-host-death family antitoxin [Arthrobacter sp. efr-133-R2A-120]
MSTITSSVSISYLRNSLKDVVSRAGKGERIQITKNGKVVAVLVGPADFELLQQLEVARDVAEYRAAMSADDGGRVGLEQLRADLKG